MNKGIFRFIFITVGLMFSCSLPLNRNIASHLSIMIEPRQIGDDLSLICSISSELATPVYVPAVRYEDDDYTNLKIYVKQRISGKEEITSKWTELGFFYPHGVNEAPFTFYLLEHRSQYTSLIELGDYDVLGLKKGEQYVIKVKYYPKPIRDFPQVFSGIIESESISLVIK